MSHPLPELPGNWRSAPMRINRWGMISLFLVAGSFLLSATTHHVSAALPAILACAFGCIGVREARLHANTGDGLPLVALVLSLIAMVLPLRPSKPATHLLVNSAQNKHAVPALDVKDPIASTSPGGP